MSRKLPKQKNTLDNYSGFKPKEATISAATGPGTTVTSNEPMRIAETTSGSVVADIVDSQPTIDFTQDDAGNAKTNNSRAKPRSAKKRLGRRSPRKLVASPLNVSKWPVSKFFPYERLTATECKERFGVNPAKELKHLRHEVKLLRRTLVGGEPMFTHLYNAREVEHVARRKHGGPEGLQAYRAKRQEKKEEREKKKERRRVTQAESSTLEHPTEVN